MVKCDLLKIGCFAVGRFALAISWKLRRGTQRFVQEILTASSAAMKRHCPSEGGSERVG